MEQQFILRIPESLRANLDKSKLSKINDKQIELEIENTIYKGIICKLPTILETHQIVDNKLYKSADISALIVILPDAPNNEEINKEIEKNEINGLSKPMLEIKRKRPKETAKKEEYEEIEQRVAELLREDARAMKVEILEEEIECEIEMLAAEIESGLPVRNETEEEERDEEKDENENEDEENKERQAESQTEVKDEPAEDKVEIYSEEVVAIERKIKERKELLEKTANPILKKRFSEMLKQLEKEKDELLSKKRNEN